MTTSPTTAAHPLSAAEQRRNVILFSACTGLQYLAGPVLYVGMTQASLCSEFGASPRISNLPETAFFVMTVTPVLLAWWFPGVAFLRPLLAVCYLVAGGALALVAAALALGASDQLIVAAVILQGAVSGATMPTAIALLWEAIGRGVAESRRGLALGLAFGMGPFLACFASLVSQELLNGTLWGLLPARLESPWNFVAVFGGAVPLLVVAALLSPALVIPETTERPGRDPLWAGLWTFLTTPLLVKATLVTILLYIGNTITANMNLYTTFILSSDPADYVGYQNALRFFCKGAAGLFLGWLLTRSNPRVGVLVTGMLFVAAQLWAIFVPGIAYLFAFGIYGAGELIGVYAPNYILAACSPRRMRQNMAFVTMMMAPAAPAGYLFGAIATRSGEGTAAGFRASFILCAAILSLGLLLAILLLPKRPQPDLTDGVP